MEQKSITSNLSFGLLVVTISFLLTSCMPTSPGPCEGYLEVVGPVSDTVMVVGQTIKKDIRTNPIFQQTEGKYFTYHVLNQNSFIVTCYVGDVTGFLTLKAIGVGIDTISIEGKDDCDTYAKTTFVVKVDSASH